MMNEMVPTLNNWERKEERKCFAFIHPDWKAIFTHQRTNTTFFEGIWFCILKKILKNLLSLIIVKCRELDSIEARKISIGKALQWLQGSCLVCLQSWIVHFLAAWSLDKWNLVWWWIVRFPDPHYVVSLSGNQTRWLLALCITLSLIAMIIVMIPGCVQANPPPHWLRWLWWLLTACSPAAA